MSIRYRGYSPCAGKRSVKVAPSPGRDSTVSEPPCASDAELWHSRNADDIEAASDACHGCHAFTACDSYATNANEATGVWAGRDRAAKQSKGKTA